MDDCFISADEAARIFKAQMTEVEKLHGDANEKLKLTVVRAVRQSYEDGFDAGFARGCTRTFGNCTEDELRIIIAQANARIRLMEAEA